MQGQLGGQNTSLDWNTICAEMETRVNSWALYTGVRGGDYCISSSTLFHLNLWPLFNSPIRGYFYHVVIEIGGWGFRRTVGQGWKAIDKKSHLTPSLSLLDSGRSSSLWSLLLFCLLLAWLSLLPGNCSACKGFWGGGPCQLQAAWEGG